MDSLIKKQEAVGKLLVNFVTNLKKVGAANLTTAFLAAREKLLESYWNTFLNGHMELEQVTVERNGTYFTTNFFNTVEEAYMTASTFIASAKETGNHSHSVSDNSAQPSVKLPTINLPTFSGKYEDWSAFKDLFESLINSNDSVSAVSKFHYLKTSLSGQAAELISALPVTSANYATAYKLLTDRFENKRLTVFAHLHEFFSQPSVLADSPTQLRRLLDTSNKHLRALSILEQPVNHWNAIIVYQIASRLPREVRREWERSLTSPEVPTWEALSSFLELYVSATAAAPRFKLSDTTSRPLNSSHSKPATVRTHSNVSVQNSSYKLTCPNCQAAHPLGKCEQFHKWSIAQRKDFVRKHKLCYNCMKGRHTVADCKSDFHCRQCKGRHHSLLHEPSSQSFEVSNAPTNSSSNIPTNSSASFNSISSFSDTVEQNSSPMHSVVTQPPSKTVAHCGMQAAFSRRSSILLSTALVIAHGPKGQSALCRVLLDNASERHFITSAMANRLGLRRTTQAVLIDGISSIGTKASELTNLRIQSRISTAYYEICAIVLPRITCDLPTQNIDISKWTHLNNLTLADPQFHQPGKIDLLIGAELFFKLLDSGQVRPADDLPILQNTTLGWIVGGSCPTQSDSSLPRTITHHITAAIDTLLQKFWEVESVPETPNPMLENQVCEDIFVRNHTRNSEGRYIVPLPLRSPPHPANSREMALKRLLALEKRLHRLPDLKSQYDKFMIEYLESHHMERVADPGPDLYYIPHHCVMKPSSSTTKLRVVFDASCVMNDGHSLNDFQYAGPKLQQHIVSILTRFRLHPVCFTADIKAMYRQILISERYRNFQCILWRAPTDSSPSTYRLNTVSYGLTSSPYLALRSLKQLAVDEGSCHPYAAPLLTTSVYIDDFLSGASDVESALRLQADLILLLKKGGFSLRKWSSNCPKLLEHLPKEHCDSSLFTFETDSSVKILGITWNPTPDNFCFQLNIPNRDVYSKRTLLSDIASIYDPCGWLAPFVISSKILMQQLWLLGLGWDDPLPSDVALRWNAFKTDLNELSTLSIPRYVCSESDPIDSCALHGFCDSSQQAYAASVYLVTVSSGIRFSTLLVSKTRVAPIKHVTIPRLELCGALLLAELLGFIMKELSLTFTEIISWTDSTICLSWIKNYSRTLPTFIANRVSRIIEIIPPHQWKYVPSSENPADLASRGTTISILRNSQLWWRGPPWLTKPSEFWPTQESVPPTFEPLNLPGSEKYPTSDTIFRQPESDRTPVQMTLSTQVSPSASVFDSLLDRGSTWTRIKRTMAFVLRFLQNSRCTGSRLTGPLSVTELQSSEQLWVKLTQGRYFEGEISRLRSNQPVISGPLRSLQPFLEGSILRVGGRLRNSALPYDTKHPMILPSQSRLSVLICLHAHRQTLHGGVQLSLTYIRQRFWILNARKLVKGVIFRCTVCRRHNQRTLCQQMGDLPSSRVTPARPFSICGLDYAGPVTIKTRYGRNPPLVKAYLAIFVCFGTKAVHIEVASDLTTTGCLAAIKRFVARRGLPKTIWSDNSTTFAGAATELRKAIQNFTSDTEVCDYFSVNGIEWKFIPPRAPHWGGLWEAAVKSAKHHFRRVIGATILTYEELATLVAEIESCLNSRPLIPLHDNPEDVLTPGHFLIGAPLNSMPSSSSHTLPLSQRWQLISQLFHSFWKQWSSEYLTELQRRSKWRRPINSLRRGDVVLIKEDNLKPLQWSMARVQEVHYGKDGLVRVVTLRHGNRTFMRPVNKLVPLMDDVEPDAPQETDN